MKYLNLIIPFLIFLFVNSCTVQNNLYMDHPAPLGKGVTEFYGGISVGIRPNLDSINQDGSVTLSNDFGLSPNLNIGANWGLLGRVNLGLDLHLPYTIGGFGLNVRPQVSLLSVDSKFNIAVTGRAGFVLAKDSLRIGDFSVSIHDEDLKLVKGSLNASVGFPIGFQIMDDAWFMLTPRFGTTRFLISQLVNNTTIRSPKVVKSTILSAGVRYKKFHFEVDLHKSKGQIQPTFGLVYISTIASRDEG